MLASNFSRQRNIAKIHKETVKTANQPISDIVNLRKKAAVKQKHNEDIADEGLKITRRQAKKRSNSENIIDVPVKQKRMT